MRIKQAYKNDVETIKNTLGYEFINYIATPYYDNAKFGTTINGVTFSLNKNNSLMLSGTSTASTVFQLHHRLNETFILPKGKYILNGLDDTFEGVNIAIRVVKTVDNSPVNIASVYAPNQEQYFELTEDTQVGIYIEFPVGATFNGHIVRAMIRLSYVTDKSYKQYNPNVYNELDNIILNDLTNITGLIEGNEPLTNLGLGKFTDYSQTDPDVYMQQKIYPSLKNDTITLCIINNAGYNRCVALVYKHGNENGSYIRFGYKNALTQYSLASGTWAKG